MILLADSGSTKTDWMIIGEGNPPLPAATPGLNPVHLDEKELIKRIRSEKKLVRIAGQVKRIYFFGAGCGSREGKSTMNRVLKKLFPQARVTVDSDLMAAALATCGRASGIVCILGTGSNCCYFDGKKIHVKDFGLGYILGDEASGTFFGKKLLQAFLYGHLPEKLLRDFKAHYKLDRARIIEAVYRQPNPNNFLASFMPFILSHRNDPYIKKLLEHGLEDFFETHVKAFSGYTKVPVHFVGSVSALLEDEIRVMGKKKKIKTGKIVQRPMDGLTAHFS